MPTSPVPRLATALHEPPDHRDLPGSARDRALAAARAAFLDRGVRRTSMAEIARRSGVSPATLYRWFGGKDALVLAVVVREAHLLGADLDASIDRAAPLEEQLTQIVLGVARRLRTQPLVRRLVETEPEAILPQLTVHAAPFIEAGVELVETFVRRNLHAAAAGGVEPALLAEVLTRVVHSLMLTPATSLPLDDDERLREVASTTIRWLLQPLDRTQSTTTP